MRIGVFGGTFDPPHHGHLIAAEEVRDQLELDRVLFVPAGTPLHKLGKVISPVHHRLALVELAIQSNPAFEVSRIDIERTGPSYTVDTIRLLRAQFRPEADFFFIMGMDSLGEIMTWHSPEVLIQLCRLAVVDRPWYDVNMKALEVAVPGISQRVHFVHIPGLAIASSDLQRRVIEGRTIKYQVPPAVEEYIYRQRLYRAASQIM
jgi:nicotinate-nucleotide adenylyltransferase